MAGIITLYKNAALTLDLSDESWVQSLVLPTVSVPLNGTTTTAGTAGYGLNTGTTTMLDVYIQPVASTGLNGASFAANMQIAPDVQGSPGTYESSGENCLVYTGGLAPSKASPSTNTSSPAITNPSSAPTLSAVSGPTNLAAGVYKVAYTFTNNGGETLLSPTATITITAGQAIRVSSISLTGNATGINYYLTPLAGREELYKAGSNSGGATIDLNAVMGFFRFWVRQVVDSTDPTGVYKAQLNVTSVDIG